MNRSVISRAPRFVFAFGALAAAFLVGCNKSTDSNGGSGLREQLIAEGEELFQNCTACHGHEGVGEAAPPLKHSDFLIAERLRPVRILLLGLPNAIDTATTIKVNGLDIEGQTMFPIATSMGWSDRQIAAVLTYVRAVLNDSTSVNCTASENEDGQMVSECDVVASPADATTMITPDEVAAVRAEVSEYIEN